MEREIVATGGGDVYSIGRDMTKNKTTQKTTLKNVKNILRWTLAAAILVGLVSGVIWYANLNSKSGGDGKLQVTATYYPLQDFAQQVGGDRVNVTNITPAGAEPHDYEVPPRDLAEAYDSDVFIYNGAGLEPWAEHFVEDYQHLAINTSSAATLLDADGHQHEDGDGHDHSGQLYDPHFWLNPVLAAKMVDAIAAGLAKADGPGAEYYQQNAADYKAKLAELDQQFAQGLETCQQRTVVTSHNAFRYMAKQYNLDVESIAGLSPDAEPSAAKLAELTKLVRAKDISYIFFEQLTSPKLAQTLASETGTKTAVFDPIEGMTQQDQDSGRDYISAQQQNLQALRTALGCQ